MIGLELEGQLSWKQAYHVYLHGSRGYRCRLVEWVNPVDALIVRQWAIFPEFPNTHKGKQPVLPYKPLAYSGQPL